MSGRRGGMTDGGVNSQAQRRGQDAREDRGHEGHGEAGHGQEHEEGHGEAGRGQGRGEEGHRHLRRARHHQRVCTPGARRAGGRSGPRLRRAEEAPQHPAPAVDAGTARPARDAPSPGPGTAAEAPADGRTPETPSEAPTPVTAAPGERQRKLHRPHPVAKAVPTSKAVAKTGTRPAGPRRRSTAPRPSVSRRPHRPRAAARGPLKAVRDEVSVSPAPAAPGHVGLAPGVEELLRAGVAALRVARRPPGSRPRTSSARWHRRSPSCAAA